MVQRCRIPRCDVLHPLAGMIKCQLAEGHQTPHINDDGFGRRQIWNDDSFQMGAPERPQS